MKRIPKRSQTREGRNSSRYTGAARADFKRTLKPGGLIVDKLKAYRDLHAHALFSSLGRLVASPFNSIMTIAVLAIAIALASGFYLIMKNFNQLAGNLETTAQISLFLEDGVSETEAKHYVEAISRNPDVREVKLISREQAMAEFKTHSGFGNAISLLKTNPLPVVLQVLPRGGLDDKQKLERLLQTFRTEPYVDIAQLDLQWVERLHSILAVSQHAAALMNTLLACAVLFIAGNTIRLELHNRSEEVIIARLVGATRSFIQRPFLYTGFWIGFISGIAAWFIVTVMMLILRQSVEKLSSLYNDFFHLLFFDFSETLLLILIASALGVVGSWVSLQFLLQEAKLE